jgi:hypothetical protein
MMTTAPAPAAAMMINLVIIIVHLTGINDNIKHITITLIGDNQLIKELDHV